MSVRKIFSKYRALGVFVIISILIVISGTIIFLHQKDQNEKKFREELKVIADFKVKQISSWYKERMDQANFEYSGGAFGYAVRDLTEHPSSPLVRSKLEVWLKNYVCIYGYEGASVFDNKGGLLMCADSKSCSMPKNSELALTALKNDQITVKDIHEDPEKDVNIDIAIPLKIQDGEKKLKTGVLVLTINPKNNLFQMVLTWPNVSRTAELILLRREQDKIVFLSKLRHADNAPLKYSYDINSKNLPVGVFVIFREIQGFISGLDYRGENVFAYTTKVADTPWWLIAKFDTKEVLSPVSLAGKNTLLIVVSLLLICVLIVYLLHYRDRVSLMKEKIALEKERVDISEEKNFLSKYSNDVIMVIDRDLNILDVSESAALIYGYSRCELLDLTADMLEPPELRQGFKSTVHQIYESGELVKESVNMKKNGAIFPVEYSTRCFERNGKQLLHMIVRDITGRKLLEGQLIQAQKLEAVGQLASGVSHEFNNLLTIISLAMEEAKRKNTLEFYSIITNTVIKTSKQAASIAKRLNEFAKKRKIIYKKQTVFSIVDYVLELLDDQFAKKNILIEKEYLFNEEVYCDDYLLMQVILNVMQNAVHAVKKGGLIKVSVREKTGVISVGVKDNGIGIAKEHLARLFDPFFTTKGAFGTGEEAGTGLGLSVSYSIMQSLSGNITVESAEGKGSTITVNFPVIRRL
ncbi:MAG: ATP-binding protein [Candidatus Firestonebacteria bacterium]